MDIRRFLGSVGSNKAIKAPEAFLASHAAFIAERGWDAKIKGHNPLAALGILHKCAAEAAIAEVSTMVRKAASPRESKPRERTLTGISVFLHDPKGEEIAYRTGVPHDVRARETAARLLDTQGAAGWTARIVYPAGQGHERVIAYADAAAILYGGRTTYQATRTTESNGKWTMRVRNDISKFSRG